MEPERPCECGASMRVQRERERCHTSVIETLYGCENCGRARIMKRSEGFTLSQ